MDRKHFASLDGLRGAAILLVMFYHLFPHRGTGYFGYLVSSFWIGVDLFFVLSGFLITGILFDTLGAIDFYRNFYIRRTLRLFPVYLVFMVVVLVLAFIFGPRPSWIDIPYLLYFSNVVRLWDPILYVGPTHTGHLWSLAIEEQFYLVWPWIVVALATRGRILRVSLLGAAATLLLRLYLAHLTLPNKDFLYFELPTRADALLLGAAAAMLFRDRAAMAKIRPAYIFLVGAAAAAAFAVMCLKLHSFYWALTPINTWGFTLTSVASAAIVLLAVTHGTRTSRILANPFLRFYGRYSYGLYLFHYAPARYYETVLWPAISSRIHLVWLAGSCYFFLILSVTTVAAVLSFHFIEKPFLRLKNKFESRTRPKVQTVSVAS